MCSNELRRQSLLNINNNKNKITKVKKIKLRETKEKLCPQTTSVLRLFSLPLHKNATVVHLLPLGCCPSHRPALPLYCPPPVLVFCSGGSGIAGMKFRGTAWRGGSTCGRSWGYRACALVTTTPESRCKTIRKM